MNYKILFKADIISNQKLLAHLPLAVFTCLLDFALVLAALIEANHEPFCFAAATFHVGLLGRPDRV